MARLTIPLDASSVEGLDPKQPVKVLVTAGGKVVASERTTLDKKGMGQVAVDIKGAAPGLRVTVGPPDASDEELQGLQTIAVDVPGRRWLGKDDLVLPPVRITPYYWFWWLRWCRTFTIHGRVLCADGSPVPGAVVCAYDVDAWWWWFSKQQVGCATTDANGSFTLSFRWCCGWWPWFWWRLRHWQVEPTLAGHILDGLQREPRFPKIPIPDPAPDLRVLDGLAGSRIALSRATGLSSATALSKTSGVLQGPVTEPSILDSLRNRLTATLPRIPALDSLRLWPWHPWHPWWDCTPDIVFQVTQNCGGQQQVIVNEGWFQARQNIDQVSSVTLVAGDNACCVPPNDCLDGECLVLAKVCDIDVDDVGGNVGAPVAPVGYAHPGLVATNGDAPFAEQVNIRGTVACTSGIDYYEIEFTNNGGATWQLVPPAALGAFSREYWDFSLGTVVSAPFGTTPPVDGKSVYETVEHYEATHTPGDWGSSKVWLASNFDLVFPWLTNGTFGDGTYGLRVFGYDEVGGVLSNRRILNVCNTQTPTQVVVRLDNQSTFLPPGPASNPCGPNTTHTCTNEPNTDIVDARIVRGGGSVAIGACGAVALQPNDVLEVDFVAHDAQGHLAFYDLIVTFGENLSRDLIALGGTLTPLPGGAPPVPAAAQVGPTYQDARSAPQNAAAPTWTGGAIRLSIPASIAFPISCCYQLELRAYKRTIVNCQENYAHRNLSERSFQVTV